MEEQTIRQALAMYGLEVGEIVAIQKGYRNQSHVVRLADNQLRNLILYKSEPGSLGRIKRANAISDFLADHGFPARQTTDKRILQIKAGDTIKYAALYTYLPGHTIPWEAYTKEHLKLLGQTMSNIHAALYAFQTTDLPAVSDEYDTILQQMQSYFNNPSILDALKHKLNLTVKPQELGWLANVIRACATPGHHQALHMDLVRSNVLFERYTDGRIHITGILDLEKTAAGDPLFDIARTLAFLLVDCKYKTERQVRKYFLYSGYNKRGKAHIQDRLIRTKNDTVSLLETLVDLFLCFDLYKFLRHNPYEFLEQNEHFARTKQQLLSRGIIQHLP